MQKVRNSSCQLRLNLCILSRPITAPERRMTHPKRLRRHFFLKMNQNSCWAVRQSSKGFSWRVDRPNIFQIQGDSLVPPSLCSFVVHRTSSRLPADIMPRSNRDGNAIARSVCYTREQTTVFERAPIVSGSAAVLLGDVDNDPRSEIELAVGGVDGTLAVFKVGYPTPYLVATGTADSSCVCFVQSVRMTAASRSSAAQRTPAAKVVSCCTC